MTLTPLARPAEGPAPIQRRELILWACCFLLANNLVAALVKPHDPDLGWSWVLRTNFGAFDALAWGVAIWRIARAPAVSARSRDIALLLGICLLGGFNQRLFAQLALTSLGAWLFSDEDVELRASAAILLALASHQLWSPMVFGLFSPEFVKLDAFMVGHLVTSTVSGSSLHDNVITVSSGHSIAVLEGCSSFANVSASLLAWVALTKLERAYWTKRDLWVALTAVGAQVSLNVARLYLIAQSQALFAYWHEGAGAQVYSAIGSAMAVLIGSLGARWAARRP